jgi:DNA processing protein
MLMTPARSTSPARPGRGYTPPEQTKSVRLRELLHAIQRGPKLTARQLDIFKSDIGEPDDLPLFYAGDLGLLSRPCVSIVGTRNASSHGKARATRLARSLVERGIVIVSGLAKGIDTAAHRSAIDSGGQTIAVIGTPLSKASPAENGPLQEMIWREHLLMSPFAEGTKVFPSNFPQRNKLMAAVSGATVIVEASSESGTLHQARACQDLGRWLFILKSVVEDNEWPKRFLNIKNTVILERAEQIFDALGLR